MKPSQSDLQGNASFRAWASEAWSKNRGGPNSIATGNAAAWLSYPVISPRWDEISTKLSNQDAAAQLPAGTDPTVVAGYKAQMLSYAYAMRGNKTAFYNSVTTGGNSIGIQVALHPLSRGTVNIDPTNPEGKEPIVDYRALSNPLDKAVMADILRFTRKYHMDNPATARYQASESRPGANVKTDADFDAYLTDTVSPTEYHPAGTCAMMPLNLGGVVDGKLKVYGVKNLRVADASIIPTLPGANTCQTVYAIAEKVNYIICPTNKRY
jgi:choline dehydrogenase